MKNNLFSIPIKQAENLKIKQIVSPFEKRELEGFGKKYFQDFENSFSTLRLPPQKEDKRLLVFLKLIFD